MSSRKNIVDFTVGTDSEFLIVHPRTNRLVLAEDYVTLEDDLGKDANGRSWEVRSLPSKNPVTVVQSIKDIMQKAVIDNPEFFGWKWVAASFFKGLPLGTHVHFGLNKRIINPKDACEQFLDHYVGAITLLLEDKKEGVARRAYDKSPAGHDVSYGKAGQFRNKNWGFEYRTPSCCMGSPYAMSAIMALSKVVMFEAINNPSFKPKVFVNSEDFVTVNKDKIRKLFHQIWTDVKKMKLYPMFRQQIDLIHYLVNNKLTWNTKGDIKESWGIINPSKYIKSSKITLNNIWSKWEGNANGLEIERQPERAKVKPKKEEPFSFAKWVEEGKVIEPMEIEPMKVVTPKRNSKKKVEKFYEFTPSWDNGDNSVHETDLFYSGQRNFIKGRK